MKNPTQNEIQQYCDGTLEKQRKVEIDLLIKINSEIAQEVAIFNAVKKVSKNVLAVRTSNNFTKNVMGSILPVKNESLLLRILNNSSNVFAMFLVVSTIISVFLISPKQTGEKIVLPGAEQYHTIITSYNKVVDAFSIHSKEIFQPVNSVTGSGTKKMMLTALIIFVCYIILDNAWNKKIFSSRFRI